MIITITSIRLRNLWQFFPLSYNAMLIVRQTKTQPGFIKLKSTGFGYDHYTLTVWENEESLKKFARSGAHLVAMKKSASLAKEIRTYSFDADDIPSWKEAKTILNEKGKVFSF